MSAPNLFHSWPYPRWIAHRGAGKLAPENTLAAFRLGARHGYRAYECDVKLSADGVPFLLHDATLERTTSGVGSAGDASMAALTRLDAGGWHSPAYAGEPIPTLDAVSRFVLANGHALNIEIKPVPGTAETTGRVVAAEAQRLWASRFPPPLLSSFETDALEGARAGAASLPRALLLDAWRNDAVADAKALGCVAIVGAHRLLDAGRIADVQAAGLRCLSYTVNEPQTARTLFDAGLDGMITDRVDLFAPAADGP